MNSETLFQFSLGELHPQSGRGITHTLIPQSTNHPMRTLNGGLVSSTEDIRHKYRSILMGKDLNLPPLDEVFIGKNIRIGALVTFSRFVFQLNPGDRVMLSRQPQEQSVRVQTMHGSPVRTHRWEEGCLVYEGVESYANVVIRYRPWLETTVVDFSFETAEETNRTTWKIICDEL
ncbi:MAG: hypothetical protein H6849_00170 [Alphaproteobacteria bacterium]|nr:MAG: hypothetical protein H6849_00170 [Alphaproteobacteria bacterium]